MTAGRMNAHYQTAGIGFGEPTPMLGLLSLGAMAGYLPGRCWQLPSLWVSE